MSRQMPQGSKKNRKPIAARPAAAGRPVARPERPQIP